MVFENLSEHSVNVMSHARQEAQHMESIAVDLEHVLLGLLNESNGVAYPEGAGVATRVFQLKRVDTKALSRPVIDLLSDPGDADALV